MSKVFNSTNTAKTINDAISNIMGTTTTSQGASADGLIVKEDLQPVVECVNGFDYAVHIKTITGVPPLSFHSMGQTLIWSLDGNTDSGNSVGDKTENLFNGTIVQGGIDSNGYMINDTNKRVRTIIDILPNTQYTVSTTKCIRLIYSYYNNERVSLIGDYSQLPDVVTFTTPNDINSIGIAFCNENPDTIILPADDIYNMLVLGSEALPYEPYGYDIPIVVNTTDTYHCYITDVLRKSDGESPVYDTMSSDGTIIRRVDTDGTPLETPIEETYTAPSVNVSWGNNTVDVDTTVAPTSMTITYKDN